MSEADAEVAAVLATHQRQQLQEAPSNDHEQLTRESVAIALLAEGHPQAFVDFFRLTHQTVTTVAGDESAQVAVAVRGGSSSNSLTSEGLALVKEQLVHAHTAVRLGAMVQTCNAYDILANYFANTNDMGRAAFFYQKCLQLAADHGWAEGEMHANLNLGLVHEHVGRLEAAQSCHERHLAISQLQHSEADAGRARANLVKVYALRASELERQGEVDTALHILHRCVAVAEQTQDWGATAQAHLQLGLAQQQQGEARAAVQCLERYLELSRQAGSQVGEGRAFCALAECQQQLGDLTAAVLSLETFLEACAPADLEGQAQACCHLGAIHYRQQQYEEAVMYFEKQFEVARLLDNHRLLSSARVNLGAARAACKLAGYTQVVNSDLISLLAWKNVRMPFDHEL